MKTGKNRSLSNSGGTRRFRQKAEISVSKVNTTDIEAVQANDDRAPELDIKGIDFSREALTSKS